MKKKNSFGRQLLLYVVLFGVIIVMLSSLFYQDTNGTAIDNYSDLAGYITNDEVKSVYVHNTGEVTVTLRDESQKSYTLAYVDMFYQDFQDVLLKNGVVVEYEVWKLRTYKQDYPLRKAYAGDVHKPSTREWGKFGWTYVKLETAENKFGHLIDEMTKTQLIDNEDYT